MKTVEALLDFILNQFIEMSFSEYEGMIEEVSLSQLYQLRGFVEAAIIEKLFDLKDS